jgi:hypothetical protein
MGTRLLSCHGAAQIRTFIGETLQFIDLSRALTCESPYRVPTMYVYFHFHFWLSSRNSVIQRRS